MTKIPSPMSVSPYNDQPTKSDITLLLEADETERDTEVMAGKHKASPRTEAAKKPLPFYQGKRRF